ncbi:MAG: membrane dipeptidase, partial [Chitinophagaceae bacterium]
MKCKLLVSALLFAPFAFGQSYKKIHKKAIVVDTHNDVLMRAADIGTVLDENNIGKAHTDLKRFKEGGLDVQLFSVYTDGDKKNAYAYAMRQMDSLDAVVARNPEKIRKVFTTAELRAALKQGMIAAMFGVEGGHMIENDLTKIDSLFHRGARYLTLTHNIAPEWATSAADETSTKKILPHKGLTDFGKQVVKRMNELGMLVDVSHAGDQTFWDVIALTSKPIIASHSSVYA